MQFTSLTFILFLTIVFGLYWSTRAARIQNAIIVLASYTFYGWWDYRFCALILISSLIDFCIARKIHTAQNSVSPVRLSPKILLGISLFCNLGLLGLFKYYGFFADNFLALASTFGWTPNQLTVNLILPVGISFYTFQTLSYTIDVFRKRLQPAANVIDYLAFVSFFPQLVAGPIERGTNLLPQFEKNRAFNLEDASSGCRLILWGFFKKLAVADVVAVSVDSIYGGWEAASGAELALATVLFAFQIYCDFSGYSDIAIGTARLFSIKLMRNFAYPYFSQSLTEFWSRWHISLSTWFRDYVYIPLGGNRGSSASQHRNIFLTFLLSGFWHGAAWTFVTWGALHGGVLSFEKWFGKRFTKPNAIKTQLNFEHAPSFFVSPVVTFRMLLTFSLVCLGWVFFRAQTIGSAFEIIEKIYSCVWMPEQFALLADRIKDEKILKVSLIVVALLVSIEWIQRKHECPLYALPYQSGWARPLRWLAYTSLILLTLDFMARGAPRTFVYFAF
jgi:D-alanyl-lipoteichoic acid acyltransferase DltB (MBOAT superfamily)